MLKWWEKTVEYCFVAEEARWSDFTAPLDGFEEAAGDAIVGRGARFVLIEFKKDVAAIRSEHAKFRDFEMARRDLRDEGRHHLIIFGEADSTERLRLCYRTYFSEEPLNRENMFAHTVDEYTFASYLSRFLRYKASSSSGGRHLATKNYGLVAGVRLDLTGRSSIACVMSLGEYLERSLELRREDARPKISRARELGR